VSDLLAYFKIDSVADLVWLVFGMFAQLMFSLRFIIQWLSSEKQRKSVIPVAFWWFSLAGGIALFAYGVHRREPVIMMGQLFGIVVYMRNLVLIYNERKAEQNPPSIPAE
jgi:lipid-A-disaccharide synthase-like uncharacterized protein